MSITIVDYFELQILTEADIIINGRSEQPQSMADDFISLTTGDGIDIQVKPKHVKMLTIKVIPKND